MRFVRELLHMKSSKGCVGFVGSSLHLKCSNERRLTSDDADEGCE